MSPWQVTFDAQAPHDPTASWKIGIHGQLWDAIYKNGHMVRLVRAKLIEEIIAPPLTIIEGWGRGKDDCFVYVGRPDHDFRKLGIEVPPPPDELFLAFVLPDGTIDDWGWRKAKIGEPGVPQDMQGDIIWPTQ